jgi:hypothetical protein
MDSTQGVVRGKGAQQVPVRLRSGQALGYAPTARRGRRDDKVEGGGAPWHGWRWTDKSKKGQFGPLWLRIAQDGFGFPGGLSEIDEPHAACRKESRTRRAVWSGVQEILGSPQGRLYGTQLERAVLTQTLKPIPFKTVGFSQPGRARYARLFCGEAVYEDGHLAWEGSGPLLGVVLCKLSQLLDEEDALSVPC